MDKKPGIHPMSPDEFDEMAERLASDPEYAAEFMIAARDDALRLQLDAYDRGLQENMFTPEEWSEWQAKYGDHEGLNTFLGYLSVVFIVRELPKTDENGDENKVVYIVPEHAQFYEDRRYFIDRYGVAIMTPEEMVRDTRAQTR